jgi:agmatinase
VRPERLLYCEALEMLQAVAKRHEVVGIDLVEVAPDYDHSGSTAILAAQVLLNFIGFVSRARSERASAGALEVAV